MELYTLTVKELIDYRQKSLDEDNMELFMKIEEELEVRHNEYLQSAIEEY